MTDYVALQRIPAPGTYVTAYQPGDTLIEQVVRDWGLVIGEHVELAADYQPPRPAEDSTDRASWEAYVVGQGTTLEAARVASLDELRGLYEPPVVEPPAHDLPANAAAEGVAGTGLQNATPVTSPTVPVEQFEPAQPIERPEESALKQVWVDYVIKSGGDPEWARAKDTTKDDLIGWKPDGKD